MNNLNVIAVDDEYRALNLIENYCKRVPFINHIKSFKNPLEAIDFLGKNSVDLILLDINMPDLSGISFTKLIGKQHQIILTTAYSEYAVQGFDLKVTDYLLKPITYERFLQACLKAKELSNQVQFFNTDPTTSKKLQIKSGTDIHFVDLDKLLVMEKQGNNMLFHSENQTISSRMNMKELLEQLPVELFIRVHKSFVVAIEKIDQISSFHVIVGKHEVPIGRMYKEDFIRTIS
ncbi:LytR/AlgR family response regulator transcription factor [Reichenbachiella sp.]|uniref:LytR/AlgR family response regulator transcription factor n=1 Tax=Reichenbachiella sp. TaxID=2184521 RepID=UPI003B5CFFB2